MYEVARQRADENEEKPVPGEEQEDRDESSDDNFGEN